MDEIFARCKPVQRRVNHEIEPEPQAAKELATDNPVLHQDNFLQIDLKSQTLLEILKSAKLNNLSLDQISKGSLKTSIPLRPGYHEISLLTKTPGRFKIKPGTKLKLDLQIGLDQSGKPTITVAHITANPPLKLINPSSALKPSTGFLGGFRTWVKDKCANMIISGFSINENGEVIAEGKIKTPWFMKNKQINTSFKKEIFPTYHMNLQNLIQGNFIKAPPKEISASESQTIDANQILGLFEPGKIKIHMETQATNAGVNFNGGDIAWPKKPVTLQLSCVVTLDESQAEPQLKFQMDPAQNHFLTFGGGFVDLSGVITAEQKEAKLVTSGELKANYTIDVLDGHIAQAGKPASPFHIAKSESRVSANATFHTKGSQLMRAHGDLNIHLACVSADGLDVNLGGICVAAQKIEVETLLELPMTFQDDVFEIKQGQLDSAFTGQNTRINANGLQLQSGGNSDFLFRANDIFFSSKTGRFQAAFGTGFGTLKRNMRRRGAFSDLTTGKTPYYLKTIN